VKKTLTAILINVGWAGCLYIGLVQGLSAAFNIAAFVCIILALLEMLLLICVIADAIDKNEAKNWSLIAKSL
jgi:predicted lipid-binding transport protein (Tim44 family)